MAARGMEGGPARVIDLWTPKEAVTKALGRGLSPPLASFSLDSDRLRIAGIEGDWPLAKWTRHGHRIAAALLGATRSPIHYHVAGSTISDEHTSELQTPMRILYAGILLKKQHYTRHKLETLRAHYT